MSSRRRNWLARPVQLHVRHANVARHTRYWWPCWRRIQERVVFHPRHLRSRVHADQSSSEHNVHLAPCRPSPTVRSWRRVHRRRLSGRRRRHNLLVQDLVQLIQDQRRPSFDGDCLPARVDPGFSLNLKCAWCRIRLKHTVN